MDQATLMAIIIGATEKSREYIPERFHAWALPLVALAVAFGAVFLNEAPATMVTARLVVYAWAASIGLTSAAKRIAGASKS